MTRVTRRSAAAAATKQNPEAKKSNKKKPPASPEDDNKMQEAPPQPISSSSSSSSSSSDDESVNSSLDPKGDQGNVVASQPEGSSEIREKHAGDSRLFSPYRTVGVVSEGGAFCLLPNQNSSSAVICAAIGERFHMLQCDRLHPVLVSQAATSKIQHVVSDNSLSLTVAAGSRHLTLFQRTQPISILSPCPTSAWSIVDLLHLGTIQTTIREGEKKGRIAG